MMESMEVNGDESGGCDVFLSTPKKKYNRYKTGNGYPLERIGTCTCIVVRIFFFLLWSLSDGGPVTGSRSRW